MNIYDTVEQHRKELLDLDDSSLRDVTKAYSASRDNIKQKFDDVIKEIAENKEGYHVNPNLIFQKSRYRELLEQIDKELHDYSLKLNEVTSSSQSKAIELGIQHGESLLNKSLPAEISLQFARINKSAFEDMVGMTAEGSPVNNLLQSYTPEFKDKLIELLRVHIIQGINPSTTALMFKQISDMPLHKALTICRTETMRAYRTSTQEVYKANSDVVDKWIWNCAVQDTTCPICFARHGMEYELNHVFDTHPRCRCTMVPKTKSFEELGIKTTAKNTSYVSASGKEVFESLNDSQQLKVLGRGKYNLYKQGKIELQDLITYTEHHVWGKGMREKSLLELLKVNDITHVKEVWTYQDSKAKVESKLREILENTKVQYKDSGRFRHVKKVDFSTIHLDIKKVSVKEANILSEQILDFARESDRLGIPRFRGIIISDTKVRAGGMGDGILYISVDTIKNLAETEGYVKLVDSFGIANRPFNAWSYFDRGRDKAKQALWHEFAHHIHQQLGVTDSASYRNTPLEIKLRVRPPMLAESKYYPSEYSMEDSHELFAERYSLYKMGREDLLTEDSLKFMKENNL